MQAYKSILGVLFGFLLIAAAQTIIEAIIIIYMHYGLNNDFREIHFKYYTLIIGSFTAILLTMLIIRFIVKKNISNNTFLPSSSKIWFVIFIIIVAIQPLIKHISSTKFIDMYNDYELTRYLSNRDINKIFDATEMNILISKWVLILALFVSVFYFYRKRTS
jgi:hypothetical protein